jgi:hypothetical protein
LLYTVNPITNAATFFFLLMLLLLPLCFDEKELPYAQKPSNKKFLLLESCRVSVAVEIMIASIASIVSSIAQGKHALGSQETAQSTRRLTAFNDTFLLSLQPRSSLSASLVQSLSCPL